MYIDLAVYTAGSVDPFGVSADLKVAMSKQMHLPPESFDIQVLNEVIKHGDIFGLLYLRDVLTRGRLLYDGDPEARAEFLFIEKVEDYLTKPTR